MIIRLLMSVVADVIFESTRSRNRSYETEVERYFEARGFVLDRKPVPATR